LLPFPQEIWIGIGIGIELVFFAFYQEIDLEISRERVLGPPHHTLP
jgi:hypothetical protein